MELKYADLKNGVRYDDYDKIDNFERVNVGSVHVDDMLFDLYVIRMKYVDGTYRDIRVYCESGTSNELKDENEKTLFFVKRLFGKEGLIVKEQRNDYIYLGGINSEKNSQYRFSRFNRTDNGKTMQQVIDERVYKEVLPNLSFKNMNEDFDLVNMQYYYHAGYEDMADVFKNGLRSRFGSGGHDGLCSLTSTFYPVTGDYSEPNGLYDSVKSYGEGVNEKGNFVFILRIPKIYRGKIKKDGILYPPLPTHKLIDYESGDSYIIPEIIYGMYDIKNKILYKNPGYNMKYNPNGLVYDQETADSLKYNEPEWYQFMLNRRTIPYDILKKQDEKKATFKKACNFFGIRYDSANIFTNIVSSFRRR